MEFEIKYSNSDKAHIVKTSGDMTGDAFVDMAEELLKHPSMAPNNNVLFDHRNLNFNTTSAADIEKIRNFHKANESKIGNGKSAILVKSGLISEWNKLWQQGEKIKTDNRVQIFEDSAPAVNWLKEKQKS